MGLDWSDGDYARTASQLEPVARLLCGSLGIGPGHTVLDVGCGTGNFALAAAACGARAVGVDPGPGLLVRARARARAAGVNVEFLAGEAAALPVPDAAFDVVASVFAVIFAPDPAAALAELARVVRPGGTVVVTSWCAEGAVHHAGAVLAQALPAPAGAPERRWDDPAWVRDVFGASGLVDVAVERGAIRFTAPSAAAWFAEAEAHHPVWRWARRELGEDRWAAVRDASVGILAAANETDRGFRVTGGYLVVRAVRPGS